MTDYDTLGLQAYNATRSFIMAINGAYFTTRRVGVTPTPYELEQAKLNIQTASYIYINSLNSIINIYDSGRDTQVTQVGQQIMQIAVQLVQQGNTAVTLGTPNKAAKLLGNTAHGAMGQLVGRAASSVELKVKDSSGRTWSNPSRLAQVIVRDFVYQKAIERKIDDLRIRGYEYFSVTDNPSPDEIYRVSDFNAVRAQVFHPNSQKFPQAAYV